MGDDREIAQTEELLRNSGEIEALRIATWVGSRSRMLGFATSVLSIAIVLAVMAFGDFVARSIGFERLPGHVGAYLGCAMAGCLAGWWLSRSRTAGSVRASFGELSLVPWKSARIALLNDAPPSWPDHLLGNAPEIARLIEKELGEGDPPLLSRRAAIRWLRYVKCRNDSTKRGKEIPLAHSILREAAGHSESILVQRLVAGLAKKTGGNSAQVDIAQAAREALTAMEGRTADRPAQDSETSKS